jgi:hypothetical protein
MSIDEQQQQLDDADDGTDLFQERWDSGI